MATEIKVPALGESITEATLGEWLKQPGEAVARDEPVASLETDKVAVEVNAPEAGAMGAHLVAVGDTVAVGAVMATIESGEEAQPSIKVEPVAKAEPQQEVAPAAGDAPAEEHEPLTLSPAVRRLVLEHGVDPSKIHGTGKDGRLTKDDVLAAAKAQEGEPARQPETAASPPPAAAAESPPPPPPSQTAP
ncbi:MAG: E3 binding domain-containing protein, partial [Sphingomonadaceae bacterium]|nr:E3 binding domain-containing protein [Sphingomonadaceae bacterium]